MHWCFVYELFYVFWELVAAHVASSEVWPGNSKPYGHEAAGVHSATEQRQLAELLGL